MFRQFVLLSLLSCAIALSLPAKIRDDDDIAQVCEFCSPRVKCANGLKCENNTCQRLSLEAPRCDPGERCGWGKRRVCRTFRTTDRDDFGLLRRERVDRGFFIGRTFRVRRCVDGLKKFPCDRRSMVCRHNFCITFTLKECDARGLVWGRVTKENETFPCCVYVLPRDCYAVQVCRCQNRD